MNNTAHGGPVLRGTSLVAGLPAAAEGRSFRATNPATTQTLEPAFHEASPADVWRALDAAALAFASYRREPPEARACLLECIARAIEELGPALIERAQAETGLPAARLQGERARTCAQLRLFAATVIEGSWTDARIDRALPERQPAPRADLRRMLIPLGPVVVFGSSNFPLAFSVAGGDTASALAAGCPVAVKAHRAHPGTAELVAQAVTRAIAECGLPPGLFSLIHGDGATIGVEMVKHPAVAAVGFTGSFAGGRALMRAAAERERPIPVFAEMSSLNPVFVLPGALAERGAAIARDLTASYTLGAGQFCTKPGLVFLPLIEGHEAFLASLVQATGEAACATMLTADILRAFERKRRTVVDLPGAKLLAATGKTAGAIGHAAAPSVATVTAQAFLAERRFATEAFGPFTLVVTCRDVAEMTACATALDGQLTATMHLGADDAALAQNLLPILEEKAGRLIVNGFPTGVEVCTAMNHGGPFPATSDVRFTSVGTAAMLRFVRPVCYQNFPAELLPAALRDQNPLGLVRQIDGVWKRE